MLDYTKVPVDYMLSGVRRYIESGIPPGHFLTALFSNKLKEAYSRADAANATAMGLWVEFMVWEMPTTSQGSADAVEAWCKSGGLCGQHLEKQGFTVMGLGDPEALHYTIKRAVGP